MDLYSRYTKHTLESTDNLAIRQDTAESLIFENIDGVDTVVGVKLYFW